MLVSTNLLVDYRFGFNGMEKDNEVKGIGNSLDFGARIYDSRLGRWLSMDPLQVKYPALTPYNFVGNSPLRLVDKDGREIFLYGDVSSVYKYVSQLRKSTSMSVNYDVHTNQVVVSGVPMTPSDMYLLNASNDGNINVNMYATNATGTSNRTGGTTGLIIGNYQGSEIDPLPAGGKTNTTQYVNPHQSEITDLAGVTNAAGDAKHELVESYIGAIDNPGDKPNWDKKTNLGGFSSAHSKTMKLDPQPDISVKGDASGNYRASAGGKTSGILLNANTYKNSPVSVLGSRASSRQTSAMFRVLGIGNKGSAGSSTTGSTGCGPTKCLDKMDIGNILKK